MNQPAYLKNDFNLRKKLFYIKNWAFETFIGPLSHKSDHNNL